MLLAQALLNGSFGIAHEAAVSPSTAQTCKTIPCAARERERKRGRERGRARDCEREMKGRAGARLKG